MQDYYHSYVPPAYETCRFGEYEVTVDSMQTRGDIVVKELKMACIKVCHWNVWAMLDGTVLKMQLLSPKFQIVTSLHFIST